MYTVVHVYTEIELPLVITGTCLTESFWSLWRRRPTPLQSRCHPDIWQTLPTEVTTSGRSLRGSQARRKVREIRIFLLTKANFHAPYLSLYIFVNFFVVKLAKDVAHLDSKHSSLSTTTYHNIGFHQSLQKVWFKKLKSGRNRPKL
jgi:hypothetical protein